MLAATVKDLKSLKFPVYCSPKLDGIRCLKVGGKALTRKFKPIPNKHIRDIIEKNFPDGIDGEIIIDGKTFNEIQSLVMSESGQPDFKFWAFDLVDTKLNEPFDNRYQKLFVKTSKHPNLRIVPHVKVDSAEDLIAYEKIALAAKFEGVMIRSINGPYKCGRSTNNEGYLLKLKQFSDSEAKILDFVELKHNTNAKEVNELGLTKRSTKKAGKVGAGMLGKFLVQDVKTKVEFEVGTGIGLTQDLRREIWNNKAKYKGKIIKYKYQKAGQKDKPRFPVWLGFRDKRDM